MDFSLPNLVASFVFGIFGWYIFRNGRHQANAKRVTLGLFLMTYGMIVPNPWLNWAIGIALVTFNYQSNWMNSI